MRRAEVPHPAVVNDSGHSESKQFSGKVWREEIQMTEYLELREGSFKVGNYSGCSLSTQEFITRGKTL